MNVAFYIKRLDQAFPSGLICRCCGNNVYTLSSTQESICNFCEAYASVKDKDVVHSSVEVENNLMAMQSSAINGSWIEGTAHADALAATKDPYFLYGAASFYKFFSDYTYYGVDYTLGGFMYSNAEKRSDEAQKNKYNAVALISKSKGFLFRALKVINDTPNPNYTLLFIKFMSEFKLGRIAHAQKTLAAINASSEIEQIKSYANMVMNTGNPKRMIAEKYIKDGLFHGVLNSLYYLSIYAAAHRDVDNSIKMLDLLAKKANMPAAVYAGIRLKDIKNASQM